MPILVSLPYPCQPHQSLHLTFSECQINSMNMIICCVSGLVSSSVYARFLQVRGVGSSHLFCRVVCPVCVPQCSFTQKDVGVVIDKAVGSTHAGILGERKHSFHLGKIQEWECWVALSQF